MPFACSTHSRLRPTYTLKPDLLAREELDYITPPPSMSPGEWPGPWKGLRQIRVRTTRKKKLHHRFLSLSCRDTERCRAIFIIHRVDVRSVIDEERCTLDVVVVGKMVPRGSAYPVRMTRIHS